MNAIAKRSLSRKTELELLAGSGAVDRAVRPSLIARIFGRLAKPASDLTLKEWRELEKKPGSIAADPTPASERYLHLRMHI